jgi:hypothetical protein
MTSTNAVWNLITALLLPLAPTLKVPSLALATPVTRVMVCFAMMSTSAMRAPMPATCTRHASTLPDLTVVSATLDTPALVTSAMTKMSVLTTPTTVPTQQLAATLLALLLATAIRASQAMG